jgi:hypothetical protein
VQADWTFILPSELPAKVLGTAEKNATARHHVLRSLISLQRQFSGKWRSSFVGISDSKMNAQSACALNTWYMHAPSYISSICAFLYIYSAFILRKSLIYAHLYVYRWLEIH